MAVSGSGRHRRRRAPSSQAHPTGGAHEPPLDDRVDEPPHLPPAEPVVVAAAAAAAAGEEKEDEWDNKLSVRVLRNRIQAHEKSLTHIEVAKDKGDVLSPAQVLLESRLPELITEIKHLMVPVKGALKEDIGSAVHEWESVTLDGLSIELENRLRDKYKQLNIILNTENSLKAGKVANAFQTNLLNEKDKVLSVIEVLEAVKAKPRVMIDRKEMIRKQFREQNKNLLQDCGEADVAAPKIKDEEQILSAFMTFLDKCIAPKEKNSFYVSHARSMVNRGSYTMVVKYEHLLLRTKKLAMKICESYRTLKPKLTAAAKKFVWDKTKDMCKTSPENAKILTDIMARFEFNIDGLPSSHLMLDTYFKRPIVKYCYYEKLKFLSPNEDGFIVLDGIFIDMINNHREGRSWNGEFTSNDIEVYDDRKFKITKPARIMFNPMLDLSMETATALKNDFGACRFLVQKFSHDGEYPPFFLELGEALDQTPVEAFLKAFTSDLYDKFLHHSAGKPPAVRAQFVCGIYEACRAHDMGDGSAIYKDLLYFSKPKGDFSWAEAMLNAKIELIDEVLSVQHQKEEAAIHAGECSGYKIVLPEPHDKSFDSYSKYMRWLETRGISFRDPNYGSYCDQTRHTIVHGTDHSKEKRKKLKELLGAESKSLEVNGDAGPRNQKIEEKEVLELMVSKPTSRMMPGVISMLLDKSAMIGKMKPVWELYKRSGYRSANVEIKVLKAPQASRHY